MSKRKGDYITVEDLPTEVGKINKIYHANRSSMQNDFDFTTKKIKDNPLYYVQYCYARICSVFRNLNININDEKLSMINSFIQMMKLKYLEKYLSGQMYRN